MRDRNRKKSKAVETTVLHIEPVVVEGFNVDLQRNVMFMERNEGIQFFIPVYHNAPLTMTKKQPIEVRDEYASSDEGDVVAYEFFANYKHLFITLGSGKKNPLRTIEIGDIKVNIYKLILYRYDRQENDAFLEVELWNSTRDTFYIDLKDIPKQEDPLMYVDKLLTSFLNMREHSQELRKVLYRAHTKNKSNGYKGYIKVSDIPDTQRITRSKLAELASHITSKGTMLYGENGLGILIGWLSYWNEYKATGNLSDELTSRERQNFKEIFMGLLNILAEKG